MKYYFTVYFTVYFILCEVVFAQGVLKVKPRPIKQKRVLRNQNSCKMESFAAKRVDGVFPCRRHRGDDAADGSKGDRDSDH